jgi:hypothetical protein
MQLPLLKLNFLALLHIANEQVVDHALDCAAKGDKPMLGPRQLLRNLQRIDYFGARGKELFQFFSELGHILIRGTLQGVAEPTLENKMTDAHSG